MEGAVLPPTVIKLGIDRHQTAHRHCLAVGPHYQINRQVWPAGVAALPLSMEPRLGNWEI